MPVQRYSVTQYPIESLLIRVKEGDIAIPEIQRPFVWDSTNVRDFIDSLYNGYPVGYLITWQNPDVRLKDGTRSTGKRILIDGQQRMTALLAALRGEQVIDKDYKRTNISIAFHPGEERFEVTNAAIRRDRGWIADISDVFATDAWIGQIVDDYCETNPDTTKREIDERIRRLESVKNNVLGLIELSSDLDVETVAEIFVRINNRGVPLNASDFVMSKMAASEQYGGHLLRKCIDYFCHLAVAPEAYSELAKDNDFSSTKYFHSMEWLKSEKSDLYDPSYTDMLRVAFTSKFKRGRLEDLVALLSGRNFETRTFEEAIAEESFRNLEEGILSYMNETNFKRFLMILHSAGFVDASLIRSQNTINFAYILYLTLREQHTAPDLIETLVRRWFVMSVLTGRYTNSPETTFGLDVRNIETQGARQYLDTIEQADLSDAFWNVGLPQQMDSSVASSPHFNVFLASQVKSNDKGFLSKEVTVQNLIEGQRHVHHIFPRNYLQKEGLSRSRYNQIANYVVMQSEINIAIGDKPPERYFTELWEQCSNSIPRYGGINDANQLQANLTAHCIPNGMEAKGVEDYNGFLQERRTLMAAKMRGLLPRVIEEQRQTPLSVPRGDLIRHRSPQPK